MRKILSLILGLLWALPAFADLDPCRNLFDKDSLYNINLPLSRNGFFPSGNGNPSSLPHAYTYFLKTKPNTTYTISMATPGDRLNIYGIKTIVNPLDYSIESPLNFDYSLGSAPDDRNSNAPVSFTTYDNTKMVAIYYSLYKEPTDLQIEEGDTATEYVPYCEKIKIATTKYNESAFSPLNTALQNAISVVDSVVSNTITQAASIATLQAQKQTRPADDPSDANNTENCPAGKKCLLVTDTAGIPHWYEIVESILRTDYTELEYLRSDGRAYINTNYSPTSKTRIEVVAKVDSGAGNVNIVGSGRGTTGGSSDALLVINSLNNSTAEIKFDQAGAWIRSDNVNMLEKNRLSLSATKFSVNGDVKETNDTTIPDTDNRPFYIFQRWRPLIESTNNKVQIYEFSIYENDILVRNMIPVKRNSDGVLGMFDTVNDVFYTNAGDGEFIAGDPVSE